MYSMYECVYLMCMPVMYGMYSINFIYKCLYLLEMYLCMVVIPPVYIWCTYQCIVVCTPVPARYAYRYMSSMHTCAYTVCTLVHVWYVVLCIYVNTTITVYA